MLGSTIVVTIPLLINIHQVYAINMPFAVMDGLISLIPHFEASWGLMKSTR